MQKDILCMKDFLTCSLLQDHDSSDQKLQNLSKSQEIDFERKIQDLKDDHQKLIVQYEESLKKEEAARADNRNFEYTISAMEGQLNLYKDRSNEAENEMVSALNALRKIENEKEDCEIQMNSSKTENEKLIATLKEKEELLSLSETKTNALKAEFENLQKEYNENEADSHNDKELLEEMQNDIERLDQENQEKSEEIEFLNYESEIFGEKINSLSKSIIEIEQVSDQKIASIKKEYEEKAEVTRQQYVSRFTSLQLTEYNQDIVIQKFPSSLSKKQLSIDDINCSRKVVTRLNFKNY